MFLSCPPVKPCTLTPSMLSKHSADGISSFFFSHEMDFDISCKFSPVVLNVLFVFSLFVPQHLLLVPREGYAT